MNTSYGPDIEKNGCLFPLVRQANHWLEEVLGESAGSVSAKWDMATDPQGRN